MTPLKGYVAASAWAAGVDLVRLSSIRHPIGRRARVIARLGVDLVIDVGANRGQFGLEIRRAGYSGRIISIEPLSEPFQHLTRVAAKDNGWVVIQSAVGSSPGSAAIHVAANGGASSSFLPMLDVHARAAPEARFVGTEQVEVARLDDLVEPRQLDGASVFTKVDVQGYELQVLAGGGEVLARSSLVQLEMSLLPLYETGPTLRDILEYMAGRGFQLVGIEPGFASPTGLLLQADGLFAAEREVGSLQEIRS